MNDNHFSSRKWLLVVGCVLIALGVRIANLIDGAQFVDLLKWAIGLYMVGNVGAVVADKMSITAAPTPKPEGKQP